ncbi:MAG: prolipoprotein diacylglyceryl transferase [Lentisphaeria bacterium]|nr:prolipoprotein diacylglyceryl transferase [Lentisphaeria bacterium]
MSFDLATFASQCHVNDPELFVQQAEKLRDIVLEVNNSFNLTRITDNCNIVITCVVIAHAMGRLGCLFAGCCHGAIVQGFPGIYNHQVDALTVPIPLFEALFLLALYAVMSLGLIKGWGYQLPTYLLGYGIWRFFIEYFRADERGQTFIPFLSPSQLISLVIIVLAVLLFFLQHRTYAKRKTKQFSTASAEDSGENPVETGENPA